MPATRAECDVLLRFVWELFPSVLRTMSVGVQMWGDGFWEFESMVEIR